MPEAERSRDEDIDRRRRAELGAFLRARRGLLRPQDVGLPERSRRHVPGLRREEVAQLANVGLSWYAMLEQGRVDEVNRKALRRVVRSLRLTPIEIAHAFSLARDESQERPVERGSVDTLYGFVRGYSDGAALLADANAEVVAWNVLADELFPFRSHTEGDRSMLALMVRDERMRKTFVRWEETLKRMIGVFRATFAEAGNEKLDDLIRSLRTESTLFDKLWRAYVVDAPTSHICVLRRPDGMRLRMHFIAFSPIDHPEYTVVALRQVSNEG
jgi:transcriptional regulator with XRE-family HTH domain